MSPKLFAAVVGGILVLIGFFALVLPITVEDAGDSVECGSGFAGLSNTPGLRDAGHDIGAAIYGTTPSDVSLEDQCADKVGTRRAWGWPVGGVGVIVLLGALVIRPQSQPAEGSSSSE